MATQVYLKAASRIAWSLDMPLATPDAQRQHHMWNILRGPQGLNGMSAAELALFASVEGLTIDEGQARRYLEVLKGRNAAHERTPDCWVLRYSLRKHAEPALMLQVRFLYLPGTTLADGARYDAFEAPL